MIAAGPCHRIHNPIHQLVFDLSLLLYQKILVKTDGLQDFSRAHAPSVREDSPGNKPCLADRFALDLPPCNAKDTRFGYISQLTQNCPLY